MNGVRAVIPAEPGAATDRAAILLLHDMTPKKAAWQLSLLFGTRPTRSCLLQ